jgi:hypothetical protein
MNSSATLLKGLQWLGMALLVAGFAGPWQYGALGKSNEYGWQPVWALFLSFISLNLFILFALANCLSYLELIYRQHKPVLGGALRWIGVTLLLLIAVPLLTWLPFNQTQRNPVPQQPENSFGWGLWVALLGLVMQVFALRMRIWQLRRDAKIAEVDSGALNG